MFADWLETFIDMDNDEIQVESNDICVKGKLKNNVTAYTVKNNVREVCLACEITSQGLNSTLTLNILDEENEDLAYYKIHEMSIQLMVDIRIKKIT